MSDLFDMFKSYDSEDINEEEIEEDDKIYNIKSWGADLSFRELMMMFEDDDLIKPEIQRHYVWDKTMASRFIESILMGLPVPSIFLSKMKNDKYLIIDGFQRFMSVNDYCTGKFHDDTSFRLSNSKKIQSQWRGKSFFELSDDDKRKIKTTTIHAIIFDHKDDSSLFQIFERINTGGRTLSPQEIRNCLYFNEMNKMLIELNKDKNWRYIYGQDTYDRMNDIEHILRFFALMSPEVKSKMHGQILLKRYLSQFMGNEKVYKDESKLNEFKTMFRETLKYLRDNFDRSIFKGTGRATMKSSHFDSIAIATAHAKKLLGELPKLDGEKIQSLLDNTEYHTYTTYRTTNYEHINKRINLAAKILYGVNYIRDEE